MAVFHRCDRCGAEIDFKEAKVYRISYRMSVSPRIVEVDNMTKDNLDNLEFCEECATKIVKALHAPLDDPQKNLGI